MSDMTKNIFRLLAVSIVVASAALTFYMVRASSPQPVEQVEVAVRCKEAGSTEEAPTARYFYNPNYGWFDRTHFGSGNPKQVIADVRAAVTAGGGRVTVEQIVHDGTAGYRATYIVSGEATRQNELAVALGIYENWSYRFESWQGELPQRLAGFLSPFAVEDLPSHYLGFFAAAHEMEVHEVLACHLPATVETDDSPPRFTTSQAVVANSEEEGEEANWLNHPKRLTNEQLRPMIFEKSGWENVAWPTEMQMEMIDSSTGLWALIDEERWIFDEENNPLRPLGPDAADERTGVYLHGP